MRDFKKLKIWHKAHKLTLDIYRVTRDFPKEEIYGITSQMRRASSSIEFNLAEGCGRESEKELGRFAIISMGSTSELECELLLSFDLGYLGKVDYKRLEQKTIEVKKKLSSFIVKLRK
ncbi:MAG: diversity-generating retroelement protein bAvd family protein [Candidatus Cloacimonadota bacterium]|nr:MAG: diversity-generating retroelement protein bAvd family protein [Candidatus Cloacimonadota bacterium]